MGGVGGCVCACVLSVVLVLGDGVMSAGERRYMLDERQSFVFPSEKHTRAMHALLTAPPSLLHTLHSVPQMRDIRDGNKLGMT